MHVQWAFNHCDSELFPCNFVLHTYLWSGSVIPFSLERSCQFQVPHAVGRTQSFCPTLVLSGVSDRCSDRWRGVHRH